jgi:hypothetical protein
MANTSGINNQSVPKKDERQSAECPPDSKPFLCTRWLERAGGCSLSA